MTIEHRELDELLQTGRFRDARLHIEKTRRSAQRNRDESSEATYADVLQHTGSYPEAIRICEDLEHRPHLSDNLRARCRLILGDCARVRGDFATAFKTYQKAVTSAAKAGSKDLLCWAQMKLMLTAADTDERDLMFSLARRLRRNVTSLGNPHVTAALHETVAGIETRRGVINRARTHIRVSRSLLRAFPNAWLEGSVSITDMCLDYLIGDYEGAIEKGDLAKEQVRISGHAATQVALLTNLGHIHVSQGLFSKANLCFEEALIACPKGGRIEAAVLDGLARLRLAEGRLSECEVLIHRIYLLHEVSSPTLFERRCAFMSRARLLVRQDNIQELTNLISTTSQLQTANNDPDLETALNIARLEVCSINGHVEDVDRLLLREFIKSDQLPPDLAEEFERVFPIVSERYHIASGSAGMAVSRATRVDEQRFVEQKRTRKWIGFDQLSKKLVYVPAIQLHMCFSAQTESSASLSIPRQSVGRHFVSCRNSRVMLKCA